MNKNKHRGTGFRDFLAEEGILEEVEAHALKRALALQLARLIEQQSLSKAGMALWMNTTRAAVDRMLDSSNPSIVQSVRVAHFHEDLYHPDSESGDCTDGKEKRKFGKQDLRIRVIREIRGSVLSVAGRRAMTLATLEKAARALGHRIKLELIPA